MTRWMFLFMPRNLLLVLFIIGLAIMLQAEGACRWEHCLKEFQQSADQSNLDEDASWSLCQALHTHIQCLRSLSKPCRGNLRYHSYVKGVTRVNDNKNCSQILLDPSGQMHLLITGAPPASSTEAYIVLPAYTGCSTVNLTTDVAYCSVFGDPHVLTDKGHFQTCSIYGAYPLIENRHLAIQVSSKPVRRSSYPITVTSISRVTVIVKASECSDERKTYEATLGHLPVVFTDYTTESDSVKLVERIPNQLIEVRILHLKTIIFIRQIGEYLSVAVRLPRSLVDIESAALYQLCSAGCPAGEILSRKETMKDLPFRPMQQAEQWCSRHNLTGPFYEACFFDFALTGDFDAVLISKEAQQDWERLAPIDSARRPAWTRLGPHFSIEGVRNAGSIFQTKFSIFILMLCWCFFIFGLIVDCWRL